MMNIYLIPGTIGILFVLLDKHSHLCKHYLATRLL
jgi:hypothetical protein